MNVDTNYDTKAYRLLLTCEKLASKRYGQLLVLIWTEREGVIRILKNAIAASLRFGEFFAVDASQLPILAVFEEDFESLKEVDILLITDFHCLQGDIESQKMVYNNLFQPRICTGKNTIIISRSDVFLREYIKNINVLFKTGERYRI